METLYVCTQVTLDRMTWEVTLDRVTWVALLEGMSSELSPE